MRQIEIEKVLIGDFPEDGVFFRVFYGNLALLLLCILLLAFPVLLQNKHTTLAENGENLISAQPQISTHLNKRPISRSKIFISAPDG